MFWSHEILTAKEHGVATIWLVATGAGRSTSKKVSRKAIQAVNLAKACETIIHPGAPIALRLQGNLLYGVSRVYSHQCAYVLGDAEKMQTDMRAFYANVLASDHLLDPSARARPKRNQLLLLDDPDFDFNFDLPAFNVDEDGNFLLSQISNKSRASNSQMSPMDASDLSASSSGHAALLDDFDLPQSSPGSGVYRVQSQLGRNSLASQKPDGDDFLGLIEEEQLPGFEDLGIAIDEDGNVRSVDTEYNQDLAVSAKPPIVDQPEEDVGQPMEPDENMTIVVNLEPQPESHNERAQPVEEALVEEEPALPSSSQTASTVGPARLAPARKRHIFKPENRTQLSRTEINSWYETYTERTENNKNRQNAKNTRAVAKKNAYLLTFGLGLGNVGAETGILNYEHPLAELFAGEGLRRLLLGEAEDHEDEARGHRRTISDASLDDDDDDDGQKRRVRPRLSLEVDDEEQAGRGVHGQPVLHSEPMEVGRDAGLALPDPPSDVPWNRQSSQIPSSSIKGGAHQAGQGRHLSSPLQGRGSILPDFEQFSDQPGFGSGGHGFDGSFDNFSDGMQAGLIDQQEKNGANTSQVTRELTVRDVQNFLKYLEKFAQGKGKERVGDLGSGRTWVSFDEILMAEDISTHTATHAFFHILQLATRSAIKVKQEVRHQFPAADISIGLMVPDVAEPEEADEMEGIEGGDDADDQVDTSTVDEDDAHHDARMDMDEED